jgi:hypothetical protein
MGSNKCPLFTTLIEPLQHLLSKDLLSALYSKFVKINKLFFKTNLLAAFISVDMKLCLYNNPFQLEL